MSTEEKREHDRQNRALRARGQDTDRMPAKKACPDCEGRGYVEIAVADGTAKKENKA
jgi:hypothetical protein